MIMSALCADAVIGNVQEKAMKAHQASNTEVVSVTCIFFALINSGINWQQGKGVGHVSYQILNPSLVPKQASCDSTHRHTSTSNQSGKFAVS